jgi:hypothetical protein
VFNDVWRDLIGIAGLVLTVAGFWFAIWQIRKTQTAAQAAEEMAKESKRVFVGFSASLARRYYQDVGDSIAQANWAVAALRLGDLIDLVVQLIAEHQLKEIVSQLKEWQHTCQRLAGAKLKRFPQAKWKAFEADLANEIFRSLRPYQSKDRGGSDGN